MGGSGRKSLRIQGHSQLHIEFEAGLIYIYETLSQKQTPTPTPTSQKAPGKWVLFYYSTFTELLTHFTEEENKKLCKELG